MDQSERQELEKWIDIIQEKAAAFGLDCYPTHFEVVPDYVIYELGSYGLPARFSHWTFGRDYHRQKTMYEYGLAKIYEIVFNTDPCQAFLMDSNSMLSHKFVVAHVLGHNDFFKNNSYFEHTDRSMIEKVRLHSSRIHRYEEEFGPERVEAFLDAVISIEMHFDTGLTTTFKRPRPDRDAPRQKPTGPNQTEYDDLWNLTENAPPPAVTARRFPEQPDADLLGFLRDYAPDLERWQRDILNMLREEMIYFIPQMRTKIINEGWACAVGSTLLPTDHGLRRLRDIVDSRSAAAVASGQGDGACTVSDWHREDRSPTLRVVTERGYEVEGSPLHRVRCADGSWTALQDLQPGRALMLERGSEMWGAGGAGSDSSRAFLVGLLNTVVTGADGAVRCGPLPAAVAEQLSARLRCVEQVECAIERLAGCRATVSFTPTADFLARLEASGLALGTLAAERAIPASILRMSRAGAAAYIEGRIAATAQINSAWITIDSPSDRMLGDEQALLLNFGIESTRTSGTLRFRTDDEPRLSLSDSGPALFVERVAAVHAGVAPVYDITVEHAHSYVSNGFVSHNSFWHERILTDLPLTPEEHLEFRRLHSSVLSPGSKMSLNPYYVGYTVLRDIERRWNGEKDPDFDEENWLGQAVSRPSGEGLKKLFDVRREENDVGLLRKYLSRGLVHRLDLYTYKQQEVEGEKLWVVQDTDWQRVRDSLVESMTNFGIPIITVVDADYKRHGELLLEHAYDGKPLDPDYAARTMKNLVGIWNRPVHIASQTGQGPILLTHDGTAFTVSPRTD